jgi:hypothetical protein
MVKQPAKTRIPRISLILGSFFAVAAIVSFIVGGAIYEQESSKHASYKKDLCRVQDASFMTMRRCLFGNEYITTRCSLSAVALVDHCNYFCSDKNVDRVHFDNYISYCPHQQYISCYLTLVTSKLLVSYVNQK